MKLRLFPALALTVSIIVCCCPIPALAQSSADSVFITFRAFQSAGPAVFVPGEFNNWGPNAAGVIASGAVSQMTYNPAASGWVKSYTFKIHDASDTRRTLRATFGDSVFQYKFNQGGGQSGWNADPLNLEKNSGDNSNSVLRLTKGFWFEVNCIQSNNQVTKINAGLPHSPADVITRIAFSTGLAESTATQFDVTAYYNSALALLDFSLFSPVPKTYFLRLAAYTNHGDSIVYLRPGLKIVYSPMPSYVKQGVTLPSVASADSTSFRIVVPGKDIVYVRIAAAGQPVATATPVTMNHHTDASTWWLNLNLAPGTYEYLYEFQDGTQIFDPYGKYNGTNGSRFTIGPGGLIADDYVWHNTAYQRPPQNKIVIYEMSLPEVVGGYYNRPNGPWNFKDLIPILPHYDSLGINAIELMPINDWGTVGRSGFSWGYDLNTDLALEPALGTPADFKTLVDSAHGHGIAIIIDAVFNQINDPGPLWSMAPQIGVNPYFHNPGTNPNEDGTAFFRDLNHWAPETQEYIYTALKMWIDDYHVDGFRFDFTRGIGWDQSQPTKGILGWANRIDTEYNHKLYLISEHLPDNPYLTHISGLTGSWHDAFHDNLYNEIVFHSSTLNAISNYVLDLYTYSPSDYPGSTRYDDRSNPVQIGVDHDEWSWIYGMTHQGSIDLSEARQREKLAATFLFTSLGVPFVFEGMEYGEERGWANDNAKLSYRPMQWSLAGLADGQDHFQYYQALIFQRLHNPALYQGTLHKIAQYADQKLLVWGYTDTASSASVMAVANFSGTPLILRNVPWLSSGTWYDAIDQSEVQVADSTLDSLVLIGYSARVFSNVSNQMLLGVGSHASRLPETYGLEQNYPNPFNPSTIIRFALKDRAFTKLAVYDILGREVKVLVNGNLSAGNHEVTLNTSGLASGVYLYRLSTPAFSAVKKMILTK